MAQQTAVDLFMAYVSKHKEFLGYDLDEVYKQAKQIENDQRTEDYKLGYKHGIGDTSLSNMTINKTNENNNNDRRG